MAVFFPSGTELKHYRDTLSVLLARSLAQELECFKWMEMVLPAHINHPLSDIMSRQTTSYVLPIQLRDEKKYDDCVPILEEYTKMVARWYRKAGRGKYHSYSRL